MIIGHSERRQYFGETDETVHRKTKAALEAGLTPIVCVGEVLSERESNLTEPVLKRQFEGGLGALTPAEFSRILLAYEPVWAIGTGRTATPEQAASGASVSARARGGPVLFRRSLSTSNSLRRQRQTRQHQGIDGAGGD